MLLTLIQAIRTVILMNTLRMTNDMMYMYSEGSRKVSTVK